ncbi:MAG: DUF4105 domain-containing protein [Gemmatimonadaceae bacterium]|nr:DUF4105 domain-containing protein [Gemmatimonadaceae bacterium]
MSEGKPVPASAAASAARAPGSQLTIYLLTMGHGDQVWEKFGHNAIWIHDAANGTDIAYHWGLFDFADKDFVPRFVQGRMRYSMGAFDMSETIEAYRRANRTVWVQELNFRPDQRQRLAEFVAWNVRPENRYYHYDYFRDNCSTRVRDALDAALGGAIRTASERIPTHTTYRFHTSRLTQDDWPIFTGTMMGLGEPVDRPISAWNEMFLPVRMMVQFRSIRIAGAAGSVPLVIGERVLVQATRPPEDTRVRRGMAGYLAIAGAILILGFGIWRFGARDGRSAGLLALAAAWSLVAGLGGTLLAGLWAFTDHLYSYRNENVLQLNSLSLVLAVLLVRLIWIRRGIGSADATKKLHSTLRMARIIAGLSVLGFVLQILPSFYQVNGDVIALALPLHLGVVAALLAVTARHDSTPDGA